MSEMTLNQALTELDKLGNLGRAIAKTNEVAAALRGSEQLVRERQAAIEELAKKLAEGALQLQALHESVIAAEAQAAAVTDDAAAKAKEILADASAKARTAAARSKQKVDEAEARVADLTAQASAAEAQLAAARDNLAAVLTRVDEARAAALKTFGG